MTPDRTDSGTHEDDEDGTSPEPEPERATTSTDRRPSFIATPVPGLEPVWRELRPPRSERSDLTGWLATMVHDIRQPLAALNIIGTNVESGLAPDDLQDELRSLRAGLEYLTELVDELGDGQLMSTGDLVTRPAEFDVGALVGEVITTFQPRARVLDKRLGAVLPGRRVRARSDRALLKRVVCNLIDNAIRHGPSLGRILVHLDVVATDVEIVVEDDGEGLPLATDLTPRGASRARGGYGVGLLFCARACRALGGGLYTWTGEGGRLRIRVPLEI